MLRQEKGITLIALVITIIVLLILAGVTIAMLTGPNGLLTRATQTQASSVEGKVRDVVSLAINEVKIDILDPTVTTASQKQMTAANIAAKANGTDNSQLGAALTATGNNLTGTIDGYSVTVVLSIDSTNQTASITSVTATQ